MPYHVGSHDSCPANKPFAVLGPDGKKYGCHPSEDAAERQITAINISEQGLSEHIPNKKQKRHEKTAIKREGGMDFPPRDYAYVPDPLRPATWRLRLTQEPGKIDLEQVQRAAAAISPAGFRGNRLEIPQQAMSSVKRRLLVEFRRLGMDEAEIPASVKELDLSDSAFYSWKGKDDLLRWFTVYSNNFRDEDNPPEILSEKAHETYVTLVDHGLVDFPELWLWHIPETIWGKADWVAYADGFAMASGIVYPGFEHIAEGVAKRGKNKVSHGMPIPLIVYDPRYERTTMFHVTTEISVLPEWAAANPLTGFMIQGKGEIEMPLPKEKKAYLKEVGMSPDLIEKIESSLINVRQAARDAGIESKERSDPDEQDDGDLTIDEDEEDVEDDDLDDEEDDEETQEKGKTRRNEKVNWNSEAEAKAALRKVNWNSEADAAAAARLAKKVNWNSDDQAAAERLLSKVNWNSDKANNEKVNWNSEAELRSALTKVNWNSDADAAAAKRLRNKVNWNSDDQAAAQRLLRKVNWNSDKANSKVNWNSDEDDEDDAPPRKRRRKKSTSNEKVNWNSEAEAKAALAKVNWNSDADAAAAKRLRNKVNWNSEDEAAAARLLRKVNWNSDKKKEVSDDPVTREEVADAVGDVLNALNEKIELLAQSVGVLSKEITRLQASDEEKIAQTKEVTPTLSLTDMIWNRSPIGHDETRVKGNSALGRDKPKMEKAAAQGAQPTLVPFLNGMIGGMYGQADEAEDDD